MLAIDVGNSCTVLGIYSDSGLQKTFYLNTGGCREKPEFCALLREFFTEAEMAASGITSIGISNVVPGLDECFEEVCREYFGRSPLFVSHTLECGLTFDIENPAELGPDLIAAAIAGFEKYHEPLIIVDLGTATTLSVLTADGVFKGVIICPGLKLSLESFARRIPYLPEVPLRLPSALIGRNTVESVQSGIVYGHVCMIEGILKRLAAELGTPHKVILCGGLSSVVKSAFAESVLYEPFLVLEGLRIVCRKNQQRKEMSP